MKKHILFLLCLIAVASTRAQVFADHFADKTLRVDYIFNGNASGQAICLDGLSALPTWAGRKHHLAELPLQGNGQIVMRNAASGKTIYTTSFSSLFQEWLETDEARNVTKGFENTFLLPYPLQPVEIEITLLDPRRNVRASMKHIVHPNDVLIEQKGNSHITPHKYLLHNDSPEKCIDVAILAEGYTLQEIQTFYEDADIACKSIFDHEPFKSMKKRFNVVAVASPSTDSGVSVPRLNEWKHTAFGSHFSTFYSDRYLTTSRVKAIHDALAGIPYEHIIILANTDTYGGGGIYNSYTLTTAHHPMFKPVVVHEFGHSFGGLADEYAYTEAPSPQYPYEVEPWEQNITSLVDFESKWKDMIPAHTPIPTPVATQKPDIYNKVGVYEGAGYTQKGIYRPVTECRMKINEAPAFCPVCQRALERLINFYTEK